MAAQQAVPLIKDIQVTKVGIFFSEIDMLVMLRLKTSKTNINYTRILIVIRAINKQNHLMTAFYKLFFKDFKLANASFFIQTKETFSHKYMINKLKSCFTECKMGTKNYVGQSFRQSKTQYASDCGIRNKSIQKLRR